MDRRKQPALGRFALAALAALGLLGFQAWAKPISKQEAENVVSGWLKHPGRGLAAPLGNAVKEAQLFNDAAGQPSFYVVYLKPSGFVIVPADDIVEPIIGFGPGDKFVNSDSNPLGALVRHDLAGRVAAARVLPKAAALAPHQVAAQAKWSQLKSAAAGPLTAGVPIIVDVRVAPLTQSQWSQSVVLDSYNIALYNYYTPPGPNGSANNYPCGCVATAMSQLMYYWQYPTTGVGNGTHTITVDGTSETGQLRGGDGAGGPYQWSSMPSLATPAMPLAQRQAIGALCSDAGVSVGMQYTWASSGAFMTDAADALRNTFMFSNAIQATDDYISSSDIGPGLIGMINPNLDSGSPVLLGIGGPNGGHAVIADGYGYEFGSLYHHLNLGWSGYDNAWYNLPIINVWPDTFQTIDDCVYNIYVSGSGEIVSGRVTDSSGNPIAGATVSAAGASGTVYSGAATTNAQGIYAFAQVPSAGTFTLTASASGYTFAAPLTETTGTSTPASVDTPFIPTSGNVWGADFVAVPPPPPGRLTVTISPAAAILAGARWSVDGGVAQVSGATVGNLTPGSHNVSFSALAGWDTPASVQVTIVSGATTSLTGVYMTPNGSLTVTILPSGAVSAGAQWNLDGGAWQNSGATLTGIAPGSSYTVNFNTVTGWITPASVTGVTITDATTTTLSGTYVQQFGGLSVTLLPAAAVTAGARWNVDGGAWQASGATLSGIGVGAHTLAFLQIPSWSTPASQSVTVNLNQTTSATATYLVDLTPPAVTGLLPAAGAWNASIGALVSLHITDSGSGVDPASIVVSAGFGSGGAAPAAYETLYSGATAAANPGGWSSYDGSANPTIPGLGYCVGTNDDYQILFQPSKLFEYEDQVYVQVTASDLAGNAMSPFIYSFTIETRAFGCNSRVDDGIAGDAFPSMATDADGNVWVAWERPDATTQQGTIWLAERAPCAGKFDSEIPVTTVAANGDCHKPAIAISGGTIYVAYEVHGVAPAIGVLTATTAAPTTWSSIGPVSGATFALQTAPAITADSSGNVNVAGMGPDGGGVQQIGVGTLAAGALPWTVTKVTSGASDQISPAIAEDATGIINVLWASTADNNLYGADSSAWATIHQVTSTGTAGSPGIATEASGNALHFVWAASAANPDIRYADTAPAGGWPAAPLTAGTSVLDDTVGIYNAANPRIAVTGTTTPNANAGVFIIWQDRRSVVAGDTDIVFVERKRDGTFGTNIRVSSIVAGTGIVWYAPETNPAIGLTKDGAPCAAWTDLRENNASHIYFASAMCPVAFGGAAQLISPAGGAATFTDNTNPHFTEVVITVPANAFTTPRDIALAELHSPATSCQGGTGLFADGSGLYLDITGGTDETLGGWVTVAVHLPAGVALPSTLTVYRLVPPATPLDNWTWTTALIRNVSYNATTRVLTFQTLHLSSFGVGASAASGGSGGGGGGGGGCTMSPDGQADLLVLLIPPAALGFCLVTWLLGKKRSVKA